MNEENQALVNIRYVELLRQIRALDSIARQAYGADPMAALNRLSGTTELNDLHPDLGWIKTVVLSMAAVSLDHSRAKEMDVHRDFWERLHVYLPGAMKTAKSGVREHQPDGWLVYQGDLLPVEMKLGVFDEKAASQLARYMERYGSMRGVAVGRSFTCNEDGRFIRIVHTL